MQSVRSAKYNPLPGIPNMWSGLIESDGTCDMEFIMFNEDEKEEYEAFIAVRGILNENGSNVHNTVVGYLIDTMFDADPKQNAYYILYNIFDVVDLVNELKQNMITALGPETKITTRPIS